jgi:hypothetical protein
MGLIIISGSLTNEQGVGNRAAFVQLYDAAGLPIAPSNRGAISDTVGGNLSANKDYELARTQRAMPDGSMVAARENMLFYDSVEGAAVDTNKWIQSTTTQTITQSAANILFNAGSSVATTTGALQVTHRRFAQMPRSALVFRTRVRATAHFTNNQLQFGFGLPASQTAIGAADAAFWRKDATGQWLPVVSIGGAENLGTPISNATFIASVPTTDYAWFEVFLEESRATFSIVTQTGVNVNTQVVEFPPNVSSFQSTHMAAFLHCLNTGATGTAVQMFVSGVAIYEVDGSVLIDPFEAQSGMEYNSLTSPTAYTQAAQWANSADPAAAVLSNTAASYATLGGIFIGPTPTPGGAVTDFSFFSWTNPAPYQFYVTGVKISSINRGVAIATTATVLQWGLALNASSGSLASAAPYTPMRIAIGQQTFAIGTAIDAPPTPAEVSLDLKPAYAVQPGRTAIIILRIPIGTATASGFLRGTVAVTGYYK